MEERNLQNDLIELQKLLKVTFNDNKILLTAITHRSYLNEHREATWEHNERLEFLGDAVLELVVTDSDPGSDLGSVLSFQFYRC